MSVVENHLPIRNGCIYFRGNCWVQVVNVSWGGAGMVPQVWSPLPYQLKGGSCWTRWWTSDVEGLPLSGGGGGVNISCWGSSSRLRGEHQLLRLSWSTWWTSAVEGKLPVNIRCWGATAGLRGEDQLLRVSCWSTVGGNITWWGQRLVHGVTSWWRFVVDRHGKLI
jgi:hypothetical protein